MFFKINVLKNFAIFTGKYLYWSLFLIKLEAYFWWLLLNPDLGKAGFTLLFTNFDRGEDMFKNVVEKLLLWAISCGFHTNIVA